jgi:hypothetical protein
VHKEEAERKEENKLEETRNYNKTIFQESLKEIHSSTWKPLRTLRDTISTTPSTSGASTSTSSTGSTPSPKTFCSMSPHR